jgi:hypothetical protein
MYLFNKILLQDLKKLKISKRSNCHVLIIFRLLQLERGSKNSNFHVFINSVEISLFPISLDFNYVDCRTLAFVSHCH